MKKNINLGFILALFVMAGCAHIPFLGEEPLSNMDEEQLEAEVDIFVEQGRVIDSKTLKDGKNIAIVPFTAGVNVAANDEVDKIALMVIKGVSDTFEKEQGLFTVVTEENLETADFFMSGHVSEIEDFSKVRSWVLLKGQRLLSVDGKMVDAKTGETVLVFKDTQTTESKEENHDQLGYQIGENVGRFILSGGR